MKELLKRKNRVDLKKEKEETRLSCTTYVVELGESCLLSVEINLEACGRIGFQQSNEKATEENPKDVPIFLKRINFPKPAKVESTTNVVG